MLWPQTQNSYLFISFQWVHVIIEFRCCHVGEYISTCWWSSPFVHPFFLFIISNLLLCWLKSCLFLGVVYPFFACLSAFLLPGMFACPGIHSTLWSVMKLSIFFMRFLMLVLFSFPLWKNYYKQTQRRAAKDFSWNKIKRGNIFP